MSMDDSLEIFIFILFYFFLPMIGTYDEYLLKALLNTNAIFSCNSNPGTGLSGLIWIASLFIGVSSSLAPQIYPAAVPVIFETLRL